MRYMPCEIHACDVHHDLIVDAYLETGQGKLSGLANVWFPLLGNDHGLVNLKGYCPYWHLWGIDIQQESLKCQVHKTSR